MSDLRFGFGMMFTKPSGGAPAGPPVQSFQQGEIIISPGETFGTLTISAIDTANTVLLFNGVTYTATEAIAVNASVMLTLDDATTVRATRNADVGSGNTTVKFTVWDVATALFTSIQHGKVGLAAAGTTGNAAISAVNTAMSAVILEGQYGGGTFHTDTRHKVYLSSNVQVTGERLKAGSITAQISFSVIEFKTAYVTSVQGGNINFTDPAITGESTVINAVNTASSIVLWNGDTVGSSLYFSTARLNLLDSTHVMGSHGWTASSSATPSSTGFTVIEFASTAIKTVQRGVIKHGAVGLTTDVAITAEIDLSKTALFFTGCVGSSSFYYAHNSMVYITDSATLTQGVGRADQANCKVGYSLLEFN